MVHLAPRIGNDVFLPCCARHDTHSTPLSYVLSYVLLSAMSSSEGSGSLSW